MSGTEAKAAIMGHRFYVAEEPRAEVSAGGPDEPVDLRKLRWLKGLELERQPRPVRKMRRASRLPWGEDGLGERDVGHAGVTKHIHVEAITPSGGITRSGDSLRTHIRMAVDAMIGHGDNARAACGTTYVLGLGGERHD
jgi:hypothetical protein